MWVPSPSQEAPPAPPLLARVGVWALGLPVLGAGHLQGFCCRHFSHLVTFRKWMSKAPVRRDRAWALAGLALVAWSIHSCPQNPAL